MKKVGFGGGCHWCTEAVFQSLKGVEKVEQGWIASAAPHEAFSEGVIVHFTEEITLDTLIEVHLLTHSSASRHSMRGKYRSAVYYFDVADTRAIEDKIFQVSKAHHKEYITQALPFTQFKENIEQQLNYYQKNRQAPFCRTYIHPKLKAIREKFGMHSRSDFQ